jgi:hypothetical protein
MASPQTNNFGAYCKAVCARGSRLTAAGAGDATEVTGNGVDRMGYGSGKLVIAAHANNTAAQKLTLTSVKLAYAPDNGSGAPGSYGSDVEQLSGTTDLVTGTGDQYGQYTLDIDFTSKDKWVRVKYTPDHTAGATDVAELTATFVLGGVQTPKAYPAA